MNNFRVERGNIYAYISSTGELLYRCISKENVKGEIFDGFFLNNKYSENTGSKKGTFFFSKSFKLIGKSMLLILINES